VISGAAANHPVNAKRYAPAMLDQHLVFQLGDFASA
jgi:hypothetical protein